MTKPTRFFVPFLFALASSFPAFATEEAPAFVGVSPAFHSFGSVPAGQTRYATVFFQNYSNESIPFFNATCSGDYTAFDCFSSCFTLQPYGSCTVQVRFTPRNGDGMMRAVQVNGYGGGWFRTSYLQGIDQKE